MTKKREELKKYLEDALYNVVPANSGCRSVTSNPRVSYVACNRRGRGGNPKTVYKLENYGSGVRLSLLVRNVPARVKLLKGLFIQTKIGEGAYETIEDFGVYSCELCPSDVQAEVKAFYDAYDAELMRR